MSLPEPAPSEAPTLRLLPESADEFDPDWLLIDEPAWFVDPHDRGRRA
jgi:hypothetical protein